MYKVGIFSTVFLLITSVAFASTCPIPGSEAVKVAAQKGWRFSVLNSNSGSCRISADLSSASAISSSDTQKECVIGLFQNEQLSDGWSFYGTKIVGENFKVVSQSDRGANTVNLTIALAPPKPNGQATFALSSLVLEGEECVSWESAFD